MATKVGIIPDDVEHMQQQVDASIRGQSGHNELLASYFKYAQLPL